MPSPPVRPTTRRHIEQRPARGQDRSNRAGADDPFRQVAQASQRLRSAHSNLHGQHFTQPPNLTHTRKPSSLAPAGSRRARAGTSRAYPDTWRSEGNVEESINPVAQVTA